MEPHVVVNGRARALGAVGGHTTLLEWLRSTGYTGCKEGCAEGECGACAVLVARPDGLDANSGTQWTAINACLVPAAGFDAQEVVTSEGLGEPARMHPVQEQMAVRGGSQCGYCTPGFICSMAAEYYRADRSPTGRVEDDPAAGNGGRAAADPDAPGQAADHEHGPNGFDLHALSGNLCRCTGYRPIRDAAYALGSPGDSDTLARRRAEPAPAPAPTVITAGGTAYRRPADLAQALDLLAEHPDARLVAGSTDWGVELNIRHIRADLTIALDRVEELRTFSFGPDRIDIGAALTLSEAERLLDGRVPLLAELFPQFASRLIRNGATLGGNLGTGSPIGDCPPALLALDASLVLASAGGERTVSLSDYFTGYRQTVKRPDELIKTIRVPRPIAPVAAFHKIAKRRFDDISSVAIAFALRLEGGGAVGTVADIKIGLGGVAAMPIRATATEAALIGRPWTPKVVAEAARILADEGTPINDHRASAAYRSAMLGTSLRKFHAQNLKAGASV
ncbi:MAG TPA: FAD binding domain-containing protein [Nakamurella sp.]